MSLHVGWAGADQDKKGAREKEMARRLQQLQQDKSRLEQEKAELTGRTAELEAAGKAASQAERRLRSELAAAKKERSEVESSLKGETEKSGRLLRDLDATTAVVRRLEQEKAQLETIATEQVSVIARQAGGIEACSQRNDRLYRYGADLLERYRSLGRRTADPVTGLAGVDAFNTYQDLRDKIEAERTPPVVIGW